jgi:delta-aminolevulinic acid dehydratase/porphobilinogen synthase
MFLTESSTLEDQAVPESPLPTMRRLVRENSLHVEDLICLLFMMESEGQREAVSSMPKLLLFRNALGSAPKFGDKKIYQVDAAHAREALKEVALLWQQ